MTVDLSAIARWPNVPACYDWLSLDRRGNWRLQGERIKHSGLINFINRQYGCDESGCWFLQNGPQRVFVNLAYTPWIFRRDTERFISHTGQAAGVLQAAYLDEDGNLLLATELGIGLLNDQDLPQFLAECLDTAGNNPAEMAFIELMQGKATPIYWRQTPIQSIAAVDVKKRFKFNPSPQA